MNALKRAAARVLWGPATTGWTVALVIPVHDDPGGLVRLVAQAQAMGIFAQIIVVDDASTPPVAPIPGVRLIRHGTAQGSGAARNRGLRAVTADYVLFFDADDQLTDELPRLLADLRGQHTDICLFKHADARVTAEGLWGQPDWDERFWEEARTGPVALADAPRAAWPVLAQTGNYPWNKLFRVQFLRRHRIRCAPTMVHNDLPLHWLAFIRATRVMVSARICAIHHVAPGAAQLTNRQGAARLQLFTALAPVTRAAQGDPVWQAALARFVPGLIAWARDRVGPVLMADFDAMAQGWLARHGGTPPATGGTAPPGADKQAPIGTLAFVILARGARSTFADLARDVAAVAGVGDHVIVIDDGADHDTAPRIGRFIAEDGWPCATTRVVTGTAGAGDLGTAINLALDLLAEPGAARDHVLFLAGGTRIDRDGFLAARAALPDHDLMVLPWRHWDPDRGAPVDPPEAPAWPPRPGESAAAHGLRIAPPLPGLITASALLAGLRADAGRSGHGDLALADAVLIRAAHPAIWPGAIGHRPAPPDPGPALVTALADLIAADPGAAPRAAARLPRDLAGLPPGARGALLTQGLAALAGRRDLPDGLLAALARGDRAGAAAALPRPAAPVPALTGRAPLRVHLAGPHGARSPLGYAHLAPLWDGAVRLQPAPGGADLILWANPRDPARLPPLPPGTRQAILSEEPFWDTVFGGDPLARMLTVAGPEGPLALPQVNHHRSAIFAFDALPYFPLTDARFAARYAQLFSRNAALTPDDWAAAFAARPLRVAYMAERRPEPFHDVAWPDGDIVGLCAWRTRLAAADQPGPVARIGASWGTGDSRFVLDDWHADKLARLDGQVRLLSAVENTHQPDYLSEKLFDAFACGARPLYVASPGHRLHDLGLPAAAWVNLWGMTADQALQAIAAAPWDAAFFAAYAQAQRGLARLWTDAGRIAAERARLGAALRDALHRLAALPAP